MVFSPSIAVSDRTSQSSARPVKVCLLLLFLGAALLWFFSRALFASNFLPHWYCYIGNARLVWTHVLADLVIGVSYVAISYTLAILVRRAGDCLPFPGFFWAFGLFIVSCGATHFMEVVTIWKPVYWLSAVVKVITALASAGTAIVLVRSGPEILHFVHTARESAARAGNEKFRALVDAAPLAVFSYDMQGNLTSWNAAAEKMFGYASRDVLGKRNPVLPPERAADEQSLFKKILAGEVIHSHETVRRRADSTLIPVHASAAPLFGEDGSIVGIMSVVEDISEAKRTAAQVRQSQKLEVLGRLAGGVAHDFNNMLMVLDGSTELLEGSLPPTSAARVYLDQIQRTTAKAAAITKQLLAFSRKQVVEFRSMDLHAALAESEFMIPRLLGSDIELSFQHNAAQSWIRSDPSQIEQVVANLAINARDAMPHGGRLTISTRNQDCAPELENARRQGNGDSAATLCVVLDVADNGSGMDEKTRAQIFEPFFTTKPQGKGTGLGLSTVYGIVSQCGGHIQVHSAPGLGTRFEIFFPVVDSPRAAELSPCKPDQMAAEVSGCETILLADDESALRNAVAEILRQSGYTVIAAPTALDALESAKSYPGEIHLLLTDIVMPGIRGTELAAQVRTHRPLIKIIYMSGYADGISETQLPGDAQYLQKPFRFATLLNQLRISLGNHPHKF